MTQVSNPSQPAVTSPWIEVFRAGDYRSQGKGLITREDLERVVGNYDPSFHEAPIVVGHPKDNLPAFGWVTGVKLEGDTLLAKEDQVDPEFHKLRQAGRYKKRSASFYNDASGKILGLRHIGYLGALPPEVKGLRDVKFDDSGKTFIEVDFGEEDGMPEANEGIRTAIADFFRETFGGNKPAPTQFSEESVRALVASGVALVADPLKAQIATLEAKLATQATSFSERETKLTSAEVKSKAQEAITRLKSKGKWIPAFDVMGAPVLFAELAGLSTTIEFVEGDKKKTLTPIQMFESFMEGLTAIVPSGTRYDGKAAGRATTVDYGEKADPNSVQLHELAMRRSQDKSIDYGEALKQVGSENPHLCQPGNASAGAV